MYQITKSNPALTPNNMSGDKCVLTIAAGKDFFLDMACNLARSFLLWNENTGIRFSLVTDMPHAVPENLKKRIDIIYVEPSIIGQGFSSKLKMNNYSNCSKTLFIDADCIVYGDLSKVFDAFGDADFSVIGHTITSGTDMGFCKDVQSVMHKTGINYFPMLCGSIYFFSNTNISQSVFEFAKQMVDKYDETGLIRLRGRENEEPLLAIAMSKFKQLPIADDGSIKADRMFYKTLSADVMKGITVLNNDNNFPYPSYCTLKEARPLIIHFAAYFSELYEYKQEVFKLKMKEKKIPVILTQLIAGMYYTIPGKFSEAFKIAFRSVYRKIFGVRNIKASKR